MAERIRNFRTFTVITLKTWHHNSLAFVSKILTQTIWLTGDVLWIIVFYTCFCIVILKSIKLFSSELYHGCHQLKILPTMLNINNIYHLHCNYGEKSWAPFIRKTRLFKYGIRINYRTFPYKRTVKQMHSRKITASVLFCLLLYKGLCCGYPFELHRLRVKLSSKFAWNVKAHLLGKIWKKNQSVVCWNVYQNC